jgi:hypothetical protein
VDARSEEEFNVRHINGARPIGTPSFAKMSKKDQTRARALLTYIGQWNKSDLDFLTSKLNLTNFPKDKTNFVIFHGDDQFDWRGLNYARLAKQSGWEHACWFRGGLAAFPTGRQ